MAEPSTELERVEQRQIQVGAVSNTPTDDEIRRMYRIAEALAKSGVYKDAEQAGRAFAKILVGRDLGLSPARAMAGLHFVEGQVQMHYRTLGAFVRANGYHYTFPTPDQIPELEGLTENPSNDAAVIDFYGPKDEQGVREFLGRSRFTQQDAATAGLDQPRGGKPSNFVKYPRNMLIARAMSNGVGWYCPEVLGGLPVYVEDEIPRRAELTEGTGSGEPQGVDLGPKVDAIIERAGKLGHPSISDRATVEMTLAKRSPEVWRQWETWATRELDKMDPNVAEEPPDAEVVDEQDGSDSGPLSEEAEPEQPADADVVEGDSDVPVSEGSTAAGGDPDAAIAADPLPDEDSAVDRLQQRLDALIEDANDPMLDDQARAEIHAEMDSIESELAARREQELGDA